MVDVLFFPMDREQSLHKKSAQEVCAVPVLRLCPDRQI